MAFVAAVCPACGGKLQIDNALEKGFCQYCGTQFVIQDALKKIRIDNAEAFSNALEIATSALNAGNGQEAFDYANKALEINPKASAAWLLKMKAIEYVGTVGDPRIIEIKTCGENAIKFAPEAEKERIIREVYLFYFKRSLTLISIAKVKMQDTTQIQNLVKISPMAIQGVQNGDVTIRTLYSNLVANAIILRLFVPSEQVSIDAEYQRWVMDIVNEYIAYCKADTDRLATYHSYLLDSAVEARRTQLNVLKAGLPEEKRSTVNTSKIQAGNRDEGGCYIATAVYGSYDSPEVIILRYYRDNILSHSMCGRSFIRMYYRFSPPIASRLKSTKQLNNIVRSILNRWIKHILQNKL